MRKFPQPACLVFGVSWLLVSTWAGGGHLNDTPQLGSHSIPSWRFAKADDQMIAVARLDQTGFTASSTNGAHWTVQKVICGFNSVTHGNGKFVAVGESGAAGVTTNGANWRIRSITTNELCAVLFTDGSFVASGCAPVREFFISRDGFTWERYPVADGASARVGKLLETWVTVTNSPAELALTSIANEVRTLCRAGLSGK